MNILSLSKAIKRHPTAYYLPTPSCRMSIFSSSARIASSLLTPSSILGVPPWAWAGVMLYPPSIGHFSCRPLRRPPARVPATFLPAPAQPLLPTFFRPLFPDPSERLIYGLSSYFNKKGGWTCGRTDARWTNGRRVKEEEVHSSFGVARSLSITFYLSVLLSAAVAAARARSRREIGETLPID